MRVSHIFACIRSDPFSDFCLKWEDIARWQYLLRLCNVMLKNQAISPASCCRYSAQLWIQVYAHKFSRLAAWNETSLQYIWIMEWLWDWQVLLPIKRFIKYYTQFVISFHLLLSSPTHWLFIGFQMQGTVTGLAFNCLPDAKDCHWFELHTQPLGRIPIWRALQKGASWHHGVFAYATRLPFMQPPVFAKKAVDQWRLWLAVQEAGGHAEVRISYRLFLLSHVNLLVSGLLRSC